MTTTLKNTVLLGFVGLLLSAACGPTFDPASLIQDTRVVGARVEVEGAPERATPAPGETAHVTWLVTAPEAIPPLAWTFVACVSGMAGGAGGPDCLAAPLARFDGTDRPPRISVPVPAETDLGRGTSLVVYGQVCAGAGSTPVFEPRSGLPGCTGGRGTTVSLDVPLLLGADANHNPKAERAFWLDGEPWPAGDAPCAQGPRVVAGTPDHVIRAATDGGDREVYTSFVGVPPVPTPARERLQISQFTTAGELKSQYSFVEATDLRAAPTVEVTWEAPDADEVPPDGLPVTFTFVMRDERGGADWTTRSLCVTP
jgi:hypothetical protein